MMCYSLSRGSLIAVLVLIGASATAAEPGTPKSGFVLFTPDARLRTGMPDIYVANAFGCAGGNTSPPLAWRNAPAGTKSFVVTLFDRDDEEYAVGLVALGRL